MMCPCKDCQARCEHCHANCQKYAAYRQQFDQAQMLQHMQQLEHFPKRKQLEQPRIIRQLVPKRNKQSRNP